MEHLTDIPSPEQPTRARLNFWAILLGSFVDVISTSAGAGLVLLFVDYALIALLLFGLAMTALGGYTAAAVAGRRSLAHGLGVGILSTIIGFGLGRLVGDSMSIELPSWYNPVAYALTIPAAVLGGWLRRRFWGERLTPAVPRPGVYPNLKQAIWLMVLLTLVTLASVVTAGLATVSTIRDRSPLPEWAVPAFVAGVVLCYMLIIAWAVRKSRAPLAELFPVRKVPVAAIWPAVATVVGIAILFAELAHVIRRATSSSRVPMDLGNLFGGSGLWAIVILIAILAPVAEELLFRGVILRGFLSHYTVRKAILASSILFGIVHLVPLLIVTGTILGSLFAWWRVRTRSLLLPLLGHVLNNTLALTVVRLPWVRSPVAASAVGGWLLQPVWVDLAAVVLLLAGIWQFKRVSVSAEPETL